MSRVTLGFLVAPVGPLLLFGLATRNASTALFVGMLTYPFALVLGAPAYFLMRKKAWLKLWQVALASAALGALSFLTVLAITGSGGGDSAQALTYIAGVFIGSAILTGITFWAVAVRGHSSAL